MAADETFWVLESADLALDWAGLVGRGTAIVEVGVATAASLLRPGRSLRAIARDPSAVVLVCVALGADLQTLRR